MRQTQTAFIFLQRWDKTNKQTNQQKDLLRAHGGGSKQAVVQVNHAHLGKNQPGFMLMNSRGFSAAERAAVTTNHLLLIFYHQVVREASFSR